MSLIDRINRILSGAWEFLTGTSTETTSEVNNKQKESKEVLNMQEFSVTSEDPITVIASEGVTPYIKVEAGTLNREMRRFLQKMNWTKIDGSILEPRKCHVRMWSIINGVMRSGLSLQGKRKAFKRLVA